MKKEPGKTQENGISDTGIPMPDDILLGLVKEKRCRQRIYGRYP